MRTSLAWTLFLVSAMVAGACGGSEAREPVDLGGVWTVARVGDLTSVPASEPRVEFHDKARRMRVVSPCSDASADLTS